MNKKNHELFMQRCLQLAALGNGTAAPNPMVGAVLVNEGKIVGEGFHKKYGGLHAEPNAINNYLKKYSHEDLSKCTLYVNLEPCAHYGKTPPCANLIVDKGIKKVIVGTQDVNPKVSGNGIAYLKNAGIEVETDILKDECIELNKRFFCAQTKRRPYIILKWAQTKNGFIAPKTITKPEDLTISSIESRTLVHKWRTEEQCILIGGNTAITDKPLLTARFWSGKNPIRVILDTKGKLPSNLPCFNDEAETIVFSTLPCPSNFPANAEWIQVNEVTFYQSVLDCLYEKSIISVLVEGGAKTINQFIKFNLWDEQRVFVSPTWMVDGIRAPENSVRAERVEEICEDTLFYFRNSKV